MTSAPVILSRAVGFDLGTRNFGWFVVQKSDPEPAWPSPYRAIAGGVVHTAPDKSFGRRTWDDLRRLRELHNAITGIINEHQPAVIGFESYAVFDDKNNADLQEHAKALVAMFAGTAKAGLSKDQLATALSGSMFDALLKNIGALSQVVKHVKETRGRGDAAKVLAVQGLVCGIAFQRGLSVLPFTPTDLKKRATGRSSGSKEDVAEGLRKIIMGLDATLESTAQGHRNHAHDAAGHAIMALDHGVSIV